jgi:acetyl-CoA synthetase
MADGAAAPPAPPPIAVPASYPLLGDAPWVKSRAEYDSLYARSVADPSAFWRELALEHFHWDAPPAVDHHSANFDVREGAIESTWFRGGTTNLCHNALDVHVAAGHGAQAAFLFEGNDPGRDGAVTYAEALKEVCRVANWLRAQGVGKGDAVALYMPMVVELPLAMLACARIGAVHSVVFGGFSAEALASRMEDCGARVLITASGVMRATKRVELKAIADEACALAAARGHAVEHCLVYANADALPAAETPMTSGRDVFWQEVIPKQAEEAAVEWVEAEHPAFMLYTSGSTGKPKVRA